MKQYCTILLLAFICLTAKAQLTFDCEAPTAKATLKANKIITTLLNGGDLWWNPTGAQQYEIKSEGLGKHVIFNGGIWLGALDDSEVLRMAAMTYRQKGVDFWPGPIDDKTTEKTNCTSYDRFFEVLSEEVNDFKNTGTITDNLKYYPAKNNPHITAILGEILPEDEDYAPFTDVNDDGNYNIEDGDYPDIDGDQSFYWITNDIGNKHTETSGNPLGVEIKTTAYAYSDASSILDTVTFYRYEITNKSRNNYFDFVVGMHVDPDVGNFQDDYIGVDTLGNFGFAYNGDAFDEGVEGFGDKIPIVAVVLLDVPYTSAVNQTKLGAFMYYDNNFTDYGNPENAAHYYGYLNARWKDGTHLTKGGDGTNPDNPTTNFFFPSNPADTTATAWSECSVPNDPEDRRFVLSSKPFNLPKGETVTFEYAVVTTFDATHPCPDISNLREQVNFVQTYYDINIKKPVVLSTPFINSKITSIYPNPVEDQLQIISESNFVNFSIYNTAGQVLIDNANIKHNAFQLDRSKIAPGVYTLKLVTANSKIAHSKIVVQ